MDFSCIPQERPVLPFDVFEQIIGIPGNDLVSLSLVCRAFAHLCRKQRFEKVEITNIYPYPRFFLFWEFEAPKCRRTALAVLLKGRPDLTRFVRKLHCYGGYENCDFIEDVFNLKISQLGISGLRYSEETRSAKFGLGGLLDHYISLGNISSLILSDVQHIPILEILSCPNITEFHMDRCTFTQDWKADTPSLMRMVQHGIKIKKLVLAEGGGFADKTRLFNPLYLYFSDLEEIDASFFATGTRNDSLGLWPPHAQLGVNMDDSEGIVDPAPRGPSPRGFLKLHTITSRGWVDWNVLCQIAGRFGIEAFPFLKTARFRIGDPVAKSSCKGEVEYRPHNFDYRSCFGAIFQSVNTLENLDISIRGEMEYLIDLHICMAIDNSALSLRNISLSWEIPGHATYDKFLQSFYNGLEGIQGNNTLETLSFTVDISLRGLMLPHCYFDSWDTLDEFLLGGDYQARFPHLRELSVSLKFTSPSAQIYLDTHRDSEGQPLFFGYRFQRMIAMSSMCDPPVKCKVVVYGQNGQQVVGVPKCTSHNTTF